MRAVHKHLQTVVQRGAVQSGRQGAAYQFEHVVAQGDDDELRIACALLDVVAHYAHIAEI